MSNMSKQIDTILNGDDNSNKPNIQFQVDKMVNLLEEMRVVFNHKMEEAITPIKMARKNPLEILHLDNEDLTSSQRLILVILWNMGEVTTEYLIKSTGMSYGGTKKCLRQLHAMGYTVKLKNGVFKINDAKIY